ncbi:MAG: ABC transporter ATP-binding protein [Planctomycetota bacterium]|nr:ABC transporter ATP-binding protein [Planctomycetota bacterium]
MSIIESGGDDISSSSRFQIAKFVKNIIDLLSLNVTLGQTQILCDQSLQVPYGQWCSVIGPSGCGKSTLLRAIAGLVPREASRCVTGFETPAFVFQDPTLMPWRSVWDNVRLPLELNCQKQELLPTMDTSVIRDTLYKVGLELKDFKKFPRQLSGGMRMRVSMARALVTQPDILFMDEPFAALDELLRQQLNQLIHEICQTRNLSTLFVTHNVSEAVYLSDRILIMNQEGDLVSDIAISLPKDRVPELRGSNEYISQVNKVTSRLQEAL